MKLLEFYATEGDLQRTLNAAIRLTTYHHRSVIVSLYVRQIVADIDADESNRWYMDASYPSLIAHYLYKLGLIHGHAKIQYTLLSMVSQQALQQGLTTESTGRYLRDHAGIHEIRHSFQCG